MADICIYSAEHQCISALQELEWLRQRLESDERTGEQHSAKMALLQKESDENKARIVDKDDKILVRVTKPAAGGSLT